MRRTHWLGAMWMWAVACAALQGGCSELREGCDQGQQLEGNVCRDPSPRAPDAATMACPTGLSLCDGFCRDTRTDEVHCGRCGERCASTQVCLNSVCSEVSGCTTPRQMCGAACVDTSSDEANCGGCGSPCPPGAACSSGTCVCPAGATLCDAARCVDLRADRANCGACGRVCASGQICSAGVCVVTCGAGFTNCSGACRDTATDWSHCGTCGRACAPGETCVAGACQIDCGAQTSCGRCTPLNGCGWCGATRSCVRINPTCTGPATGTCPGNWSCAPGDCARLAQPCATESDCDPTGSPIASRCIISPGNGPGATCAKVCRTNADCASQCCAPTVSGVSVCVHFALCISRTCSISAGSSASCLSGGTEACCSYVDVGDGRPTATQCDYSYSMPICARLCTRNSDCLTGCCSLDPGVDIWRCASPTGRVCSPL